MKKKLHSHSQTVTNTQRILPILVQKKLVEPTVLLCSIIFFGSLVLKRWYAQLALRLQQINIKISYVLEKISVTANGHNFFKTSSIDRYIYKQFTYCSAYKYQT